MANKIGRNKKRCDAYRTGGHLAFNKALKKERNEKRVAKFAKRREEGRSYAYRPNPYTTGTYEYNEEKRRRAEKNVRYKTTLAKTRSIMAKLENELAEKKAEFKVAKGRKKQ